ncbi:GtrA-like protein [Arthrobacter saudimassiliensis]|uniref:GtrA-like protein n=1 Tax=Arthrobacter saudimassiliensis TaxID=1461584 RepID=A0A078MTB5_9MICC|nr:GtrA-like protein [Arthrobacter saudimassiliensis]
MTTGQAARQGAPGLRWSAFVFLAAGIGNNVVTFAEYTVLTVWGVEPSLAVTAAYLTGLGITFSVNRRWTFRHRQGRGPALLRFLAVSLTGYLLNLAILQALLAGTGLGPIPAQLAAVTLVAFFTFTALRTWVFRERRA